MPQARSQNSEANPSSRFEWISTGTGWGRITIDHSGLTLALDHGSLRLRSLTVRGRELLDSGGLTLHAGDTAQRPLGTEDPR